MVQRAQDLAQQDTQAGPTKHADTIQTLHFRAELQNCGVDIHQLGQGPGKGWACCGVLQCEDSKYLVLGDVCMPAGSTAVSLLLQTLKGERSLRLLETHLIVNVVQSGCHCRQIRVDDNIGESAHRSNLGVQICRLTAFSFSFVTSSKPAQPHALSLTCQWVVGALHALQSCDRSPHSHSLRMPSGAARASLVLHCIQCIGVGHDGWRGSRVPAGVNGECVPIRAR